MVRRSLIVAALLAVSSPLAAQDEWVWSSNRPDADAPLGVTGARTLDLGTTEITYRFTQMNSRGVWFATDSLPLATTLQLYQVAPLTLSKQTHSVMAARGITENLTVTASAEFSIYERDQLTSGGIYYITGAEELGDVIASAIYEAYRAGPYRLNFSMGAVIPVGKSRTWATTPFSGAGEEPLPYDMRPGGGTFAVMPGITGQMQNEVGSIGAQFRGRINVGDGASDFALGDSYEANGWAAYKFNDVFSASAGIRWQIWGNIEGADPLLNATRDPGSDPVFLAGQRADMPVGVNFVMPGDGPLAGHRMFFEATYTLHQDYEGPQLGLDWGINVGYKVAF
ncbi:MAG: hypothetical protein OEO79_03515 [Gemmatimonadota bacterium]|nr:hypothetical protein [Gemmatimonadota bacterium]MDH3423356.1 hypothetical protein [Gemmatimonadota bacterium]